MVKLPIKTQIKMVKIRMEAIIRMKAIVRMDRISGIDFKVTTTDNQTTIRNLQTTIRDLQITIKGLQTLLSKIHAFDNSTQFESYIHDKYGVNITLPTQTNQTQSNLRVNGKSNLHNKNRGFIVSQADIYSNVWGKEFGTVVKSNSIKKCAPVVKSNSTVVNQGTINSIKQDVITVTTDLNELLNLQLDECSVIEGRGFDYRPNEGENIIFSGERQYNNVDVDHFTGLD